VHTSPNKKHLLTQVYNYWIQNSSVLQTFKLLFNKHVLLFLVPLGVDPFLGTDSFRRNWFSALGGLLVAVLLKLVFWLILVSSCNQDCLLNVIQNCINLERITKAFSTGRIQCLKGLDPSGFHRTTNSTYMLLHLLQPLPPVTWHVT
jgi:hypothetical protein